MITTEDCENPDIPERCDYCGGDIGALPFQATRFRWFCVKCFLIKELGMSEEEFNNLNASQLNNKLSKAQKVEKRNSMGMINLRIERVAKEMVDILISRGKDISYDSLYAQIYDRYINSKKDKIANDINRDMANMVEYLLRRGKDKGYPQVKLPGDAK